MKSWATANLAASTTCSEVISGFPNVMFSKIEPLNKKSSWRTTPICCRNDAKSALLISNPSIRIRPDSI